MRLCLIVNNNFYSILRTVSIRVERGVCLCVYVCVFIMLTYSSVEKKMERKEIHISNSNHRLCQRYRRFLS